MSEQNLPPATPQQSSGSGPTGSEQVGPAPTGSEQVGSAPPGSEQVGSAPEATEPAATTPAKSRGRSILTRVLSAVVALLVVGGVWAFFNRDDTRAATAGSCIADLPEVAPGEEKRVDDAKVVDCESEDATYKVEGRVNDTTLEQAQGETVCQPFAATEFVYYSIPEGGRGYVLCLSQIQR